MATEKNNTEIAKVYCIATFINCQEEKLDKDYADKRKKAHAWKWKMKQAWSYVIEDFLNNTYDHTVLGTYMWSGQDLMNCWLHK